MWSKFQQRVLWILTYSPLIIVMIYRFIAGNEFFGIDNWIQTFKWVSIESIFVSYMALEVYFVIFILLYTFTIYKLAIKWFLAGYESRIAQGQDGEDYYIRKAEKLSANDYSFFLLTLLLPLISLDHSSITNLVVSLLIIFFVIAIYVNTDAISVCPILFFSGRKVYKGIISAGEKQEEVENPSLRKEVVFMIKKENISFDRKVRGERLVNGFYYLTDKNE